MSSQKPDVGGPGWVYVLTCPDFPGCSKIGGTGRTATHRAAELPSEYGTVNAFTVVDRHPVADWRAVEQAAHRMLSDRRLPRSEVFRCAPAEASRVIRAAALAYTTPWAVTAWLRRKLLYPQRPERPSYRWRRRRRRSTDGSVFLVSVVVLAASVVIWKPPLPTWLPPQVLRVAVMLERLRF